MGRARRRKKRGTGRRVILFFILLVVFCGAVLLLTPAREKLEGLFVKAPEGSLPASVLRAPETWSPGAPPRYPDTLPLSDEPLLPEPDFVTNCEAIYLADMSTGQVLYEKNSDMQIYPASTTKIMTGILMMEQMKDRDTATVVADPEIITSFYGTSASNAAILPGEEMTLTALLHCVLLPSGNEASTIAAQYIAGTEHEFARMMTERARELGCTGTNFTNSHGLHDDNHYTTAHDLAIMARYFWRFPTLRETCSLYSYHLDATNKQGERDIYTTLMMQNPNSSYYYEPIHGIKTGTTTQAGRCFVSTATKNGRTLLLVAMKAPYRDENGNVTEGNLAFEDTKNLYEWAFQELRRQSAA